MNENEYLNQLGDALNMLSPEEITDIQNYYANSIRGEVMNGISEENAVEHLGPPDQVADRILRTRAQQPAQGPMMAAPRKHRGVGIAIAAVVIAGCIGVAGVGRAVTNVFEHSNNPNNVVSAVTGAQSFTAAGGTVQAISIDAGSDDVTFEESPDDDIHLQWNNRKSLSHSASQNGTDLTLTTQSGNGVDFGLTFGEDDDRVCIQLPDGYEVDSLQVQTSSGEISLDSMIVKTNAKLHTTSGDIDAYNLVSRGGLTAESTSGEIYLQTISASDINATSTSGSIDLSDCTTTGEVNMQSVSGDIYWNEGSAAGKVGIFTTSGYVQIQDVHGKDAVTVGTTSGDIELQFSNNASDYSIETSTISGDVDVPHAQGSVPMKLETVSGNIQVQLDN
jgi:hypothetical protein